jgi:hypothetical protein
MGIAYAKAIDIFEDFQKVGKVENMKKLIKATTLVLVIIMLALPMAACEEEPEGPAEEMGEQIDESMEEAADQLEEAADEMEEQTDQ